MYPKKSSAHKKPVLKTAAISLRRIEEKKKKKLERKERRAAYRKQGILAWESWCSVAGYGVLTLIRLIQMPQRRGRVRMSQA